MVEWQIVSVVAEGFSISAPIPSIPINKNAVMTSTKIIIMGLSSRIHPRKDDEIDIDALFEVDRVIAGNWGSDYTFTTSHCGR